MLYCYVDFLTEKLSANQIQLHIQWSTHEYNLIYSIFSSLNKLLLNLTFFTLDNVLHQNVK